jgi:hypothetical protein
MFEVLGSEASGEFQGYSVTGAIAGFVVVELLLFSTKDLVEKLKEAKNSRVEELHEERGTRLPKTTVKGGNF